MNKVFLMGYLARDAELKHGANADFARTAVAVNRPFSKEKAADFLNLVAFGKTAEFLSKYFQKGSKILVEGRLQTSSYEKDGVKVNAVDVIVENIEFAGGKKKDEPSDKTDSPNDFGGKSVDDSDVPF